MPPDQTLPLATIRRVPEDFVVDEIPVYPASGQGEHLFVTFRKVGRTTIDAVQALASALEVDPRGAGYAGMKDRHAVTTQTASFPFPMARELEGAMARCAALEGISIVEFARHGNKLKPGHLIGNRFRIVLRGLESSEREAVCAKLIESGALGVPNAFGPQRFGRDGDNPTRALAWLAGKERGPRDRREQRLLFSSLQSLLFNRVLERRESEGTWASILPGDLAKKHDSGGLFDVPLEGPELEDAQTRATAGLVSPTGPMFGAKMRWPQGDPASMEREILRDSIAGEIDIDAFRHLGEGTRRALRMSVAEMEILSSVEDGITVTFVLPKGGYATTVLGRACRLVDATHVRAPSRDREEEEREDPVAADVC